MARKPPVKLEVGIDIGARSKIESGKLVTRLQEFIMCDDIDYPDDDALTPKRRKNQEQIRNKPKHKDRMTPAQVTAALGLLKKTVPDMAAITITGGNEPIKQIVEIRRTIVRPKTFDEKD